MATNRGSLEERIASLIYDAVQQEFAGKRMTAAKRAKELLRINLLARDLARDISDIVYDHVAYNLANLALEGREM